MFCTAGVLASTAVTDPGLYRPMQLTRFSFPNSAIFFVAACLLFSAQSFAEDARQTPLVRAVKNCGPSVVNLRGRKTVRDEAPGSTGQIKQVNGMGTGVVIDPRGYILTNYHVVEGVAKIQVTTHDRTKTIGRLIAHDPVTDLALLKIDIGRDLPVIDIGTSSDLMLAETVAAVGNAYGYEHTVTVGIISQLGRTVQVNDQQIYRNLIQTDAPINPGNSGGPLLNLNGKMIGINVAVRIGAQGIAFAIPVNDAMDVAAELMSQVVDRRISHGLRTKTVYVDNKPQLMVEGVRRSSAAEKAGLKNGEQIVRVNNTPVVREFEFHRQLLELSNTEGVELTVSDGKKQRKITLRPTVPVSRPSSLAWEALGLRLTPATSDEMRNRHPNYQRGLKVVEVRRGSSADNEGIIEGDILVAMHGWKTETLDNLAYILENSDNNNQKEFMFYILRDKEPFWGRMRIASSDSR